MIGTHFTGVLFLQEEIGDDYMQAKKNGFFNAVIMILLFI